MTKTLAGLHIEGRRWFQRSAGNTYHSVRIFANNKQLAYIPFEYGYDDQYLQTVLDWLAKNGYIPEDPSYPGSSVQYGTLFLREELGGTYTAIDVDRKKDL